MFELVRIARVLGISHLSQLRRARRLGGDNFIRGYLVTSTILALFKVGFFDALSRDGAVDSQSFATDNGLQVDILGPLCDYLYAIKILDKQGTRYILSPRGQLIGNVLRGSFYATGAYSGMFHDLASLLKGEKRYGVDIHRDICLTAQGSGELGRLFAFPMVAYLIRKERFSKVLDLGCGDATFLIDLCREYDKVAGYGVDVSHEAIENGRRNLLQCNLNDRVRLFAEDMFSLVSLKDQLEGIDVATGFFILHEFARQDAPRIVAFLKDFRRMFPGVPMIFSESVRHTPKQIRHRGGPLADFQLIHDLSGQRTLARKEWRELFAMAGFTSVVEDYFGSLRMVIYKVR